MLTNKITLLNFILLIVIPFIVSADTNMAFKLTDVDVIEIKNIPSSTVLINRSDLPYFESKNLFMPLFWYISMRQISMTTPVEVGVDPGEMIFFVDSKDLIKKPESTKSISVEVIPERKVASIGCKGGYSEANFNKAKLKLIEWIHKQDKYIQIGEARLIYWDGPSTNNSEKRSEVHIQVGLKAQ